MALKIRRPNYRRRKQEIKNLPLTQLFKISTNPSGGFFRSTVLGRGPSVAGRQINRLRISRRLEKRDSPKGMTLSRRYLPFLRPIQHEYFAVPPTPPAHRRSRSWRPAFTHRNYREEKPSLNPIGVAKFGENSSNGAHRYVRVAFRRSASSIVEREINHLPTPNNARFSPSRKWVAKFREYLSDIGSLQQFYCRAGRAAEGLGLSLVRCVGAHRAGRSISTRRIWRACGAEIPAGGMRREDPPSFAGEAIS
ncbi:MAG: hypothetical protein JWN66_2237 [Sphingomonas bacterium]|nr:hypothetical protein [Sphingomonas bacterium]